MMMVLLNVAEFILHGEYSNTLVMSYYFSAYLFIILVYSLTPQIIISFWKIYIVKFQSQYVDVNASI